ncbi:MAG: M64 family metallopeptidase [Bdellovibrionota bacterium]
MVRHLALVLVLGTSLFSAEVFARSYKVKYLENENGRIVLSQGWVAAKAPQEGWVETSYPQSIQEHSAIDSNKVVELIAADADVLQQELVNRNVAPKAFDPMDFVEADEEVVTLVHSGPSENRIDLVFMGDGYTQAERDKFFEDARRLTDDMFKGETFRSYLPIFNVHAVFKPSNVSGIGVGSTPKDTAYGLYRQGNTLRAIFATNTSAARRSCAQAPDCDYPILMANDPYYGGLGGEFAITTSSPTSGTKVLRHELGHNFGKVGEEYDGGGYFGANTSSSVSSVKWKHWTDGNVSAEPAIARHIEWPWHHLSEGPYTASFRSNGAYRFFEVQYSASGIETDDTLDFRLDGEALPSPSPGHSDREFVEYFHDGGLTSGSHKITVSEKVHDGNNWLSDLTVYEYGEDYHFDPEHVGAYPLFSEWGSVAAYRSTHETCLMRNMKSVRFCPICQENNWLQFFRNVSLIDGVDVTPVGSNYEVHLRVPPLGQFRNEVLSPEERLDVRWYRDGQLVGSFEGQLVGQIPAIQAQDKWEVEVEFHTPEVRKDPSGLLKARKRIQLTN